MELLLNTIEAKENFTAHGIYNILRVFDTLTDDCFATSETEQCLNIFRSVLLYMNSKSCCKDIVNIRSIFKYEALIIKNINV